MLSVFEEVDCKRLAHEGSWLVVVDANLDAFEKPLWAGQQWYLGADLCQDRLRLTINYHH